MIINHRIEDHEENLLKEEVIDVPLRSEHEFELWLKSTQTGFAIFGVENDISTRHWGKTASTPYQMHYWWRSSPYD